MPPKAAVQPSVELPSGKVGVSPKPAPNTPADFSNPPPVEDPITGASAATSEEALQHRADKPSLTGPAELASLPVLARTLTSTTYRRDGGTATAEIHSQPINWKDSSGRWQPIDSTLVRAGNGWKNRSGPVVVELAGETGPGALTKLTGEGWGISVSVEGVASGVRATTKGTKAIYAGVAPGVKLETTVTTTALKEFVVLEAAPSGQGNMVFRFPLSLEGVKPAVNSDGSVSFVDAAGTTKLVLQRAFAWDSAGDSGGQPVPIDQVVNRSGDHWTIETTVPGGWLRDAARVFPVTVDPWFNFDLGTQSSVWDAYISSNPADRATNYDGALQFDGSDAVDRIGYSTFSSVEHSSYMKFDLGVVNRKQIIDADLRFWTYSKKHPGNWFWIWRMTQPWEPWDIKYDNLWRLNHGTEEIAVTDTMAVAGQWGYVDMTTWVQNWANGSWPNYGFSMDTKGLDGYVRIAAAESAGNSPAIYVTFNNNTPVAGTPADPPSGTTVATTTPILTGNHGSDGDSDPLMYWFRISANGNPDVNPIVDSGWFWASPLRYQIPASANLQPGVTYSWKLYTTDGVETVASATRTFTVASSTVTEFLRVSTSPPGGGGTLLTSVPVAGPTTEQAELNEIPSQTAALPHGQVPLHEVLTGQPSGFKYRTASDEAGDILPDCRSEPQAKDPKGWVLGHFSWCSVVHPQLVKQECNSVLGCVELILATWEQVTIGHGSNDGRNFKFITFLDFGNVHPDGWDEPVELRIECNLELGSLCSPLRHSEIKTVAEWKALGRWEVNFSSPQEGGFDDDPLHPEWLSWYQLRPVVNWVGRNEVAASATEGRCDTAKEYIRTPGNGGCVFDDIYEILQFDATDRRYEQAAKHVYEALYHPGTTYPPKEGCCKQIPGSKESGFNLTRNYWDFAMRENNRNYSVEQCRALDPNYRDRGLQCDEYPMASTFQGSTSPVWDFSVCPIDGAQNEYAGREIVEREFYKGTRIIHEHDRFWVTVVGTSSVQLGCTSRVEDDFTGPNQQSWNGAKWTTTTNGTQQSVDLASNEGQMLVAGNSARATVQMDAVADSETSLRYRFSDRNGQSAFRVTLRGSGGTGSDQLTTGYRLEVRSDSPTVELQKTVNGTVSTLTTIPYTQTTEAQWLRFEVKGSTVRARLWPTTAVEPTAWLAEVTDPSVTGLGVLQLAHSFTSGAARSVFVDDVTILQTSTDITATGWDAGHNDVATTLVMPRPAGTTAGNVLVAGVATRGTPTVTPPAGWTLIRAREAGSSWTLQSYYKVASASEPTDYTWTLSVAKAAAGTITAYSGVDTTNPIDVSGGQINSTATTLITAPSVTTTVKYARLVGLFVNDGAATIIEPEGMTERGEDSSNAPSQAHVTIESADRIQPTAGASGDKTATTAAANRTAAELIALRPAYSRAGEITIAGWATGQNNVATTLVLPKPAGSTAGDVLIAAVAVRGVPTVTAPTGWTLIRSDSNGSSMKTLTYWRVNTGSEPANYTWSFSSSKAAAGAITAYTGVNTTNPVDVHSGFANTTDTSQILAPSVTTTEANERLIGFFSIMKVTGIAPPTGMQELAETSASNGTDPPVTIEIADAIQGTAGASGDKTATAGTADRNTGQIIALRPA